MEEVSRRLPGGTEENNKIPVKKADVPSEIRRGNPLNEGS
jgi:hypothetical protein